MKSEKRVPGSEDVGLRRFPCGGRVSCAEGFEDCVVFVVDFLHSIRCPDGVSGAYGDAIPPLAERRTDRCIARQGCSVLVERPVGIRSANDIACAGMGGRIVGEAFQFPELHRWHLTCMNAFSRLK